ncbi:MAG: oligosaccharide flippase family protein, partial [Mucilaginibacter sp.]
MELRKKTISGLIWTFSQQFSVQIIYFVVQIVLARLLSPSAFGLIAMLQIFLALGQSLI